MTKPAAVRWEVRVQTDFSLRAAGTLTKRAACTGAGMPAVAVDGLMEPPDQAGPSISREETGIELTWGASRGEELGEAPPLGWPRIPHLHTMMLQWDPVFPTVRTPAQAPPPSSTTMRHLSLSQGVVLRRACTCATSISPSLSPYSLTHTHPRRTCVTWISFSRSTFLWYSLRMILHDTWG